MQDSADEDGAAPIAIVTHVCSRNEIDSAVSKLAQLETSVDAPRLIRIESEV